MSALKKLLATVALISTLVAPAAAVTPGGEYCAMVAKTSDEFLALRKEPTANSEMIAAMRTGFPVHVSASSQSLDGDKVSLYKNWTKWTYVSAFVTDSSADPDHGWVYSKYLKRVPCEGSGFSWWK